MVESVRPEPERSEAGASARAAGAIDAASRRVAASTSSCGAEGGRVSLEKVGYQWSDAGASVEVSLACADADPESLAFSAGAADVDVRVRGGDGRVHFFAVARTHAPLDSARCTARVSRDRQRVLLSLAKREPAGEWPRLRWRGAD